MKNATPKQTMKDKQHLVQLYDNEPDWGHRPGWSTVGRPHRTRESAEKEKALYERACEGLFRIIEYTPKS